MNPQTPKPELSCPCCGSTNWFCYPEPVGNPFRHCNECDCKWDNRKRRTPAAKPAAAGEVGPESVAEIQKSREHYKAGANKMVRRIYCLRDGLHQITRDWKGLSPQQIGQFAQLILDREPQPKDDEAVDAVLLENMDDSYDSRYGKGLFATHNCVRQVYLHPPAAQPLPAGGVDFSEIRARREHALGLHRRTRTVRCDG